MKPANFDENISRVGTHCAKWDAMQSQYGVSPSDGIAMWVADMDFRPPQSVQRTVQSMADHGIYGYFGDNAEYLSSIVWWMKERHQWHIEPDWIFNTHGLVNGTAMCVDTFTEPGDGVILMTPVYHVFARIVRAAGREAVELPMPQIDGQYAMDLAAWQKQLTGREKMVILCSPHNPGGRVWTPQELKDLAAFCQQNDLLIVSDEIHHDLVMPGNQHTVMANAAPDAIDRTIILSAATKTFNLAGAHIGNVIIANPALHEKFDRRMKALGMSPNAFGMNMIPGAYCAEGAQWLDQLLPYLDSNRQLFESAVNALPGVRAMQLQATYLAWVDFSGTGMTDKQLAEMISQRAKIAVNYGPTFGPGGEQFLRFNLATPKSRIQESIRRLQAVFA